MKNIVLLSIFILSGCDTFYGLRVPVTPKYEGSWDCALSELETKGMRGEVVVGNQLSVTDIHSGEYLFTADPNRSESLELYAMQVHAIPECTLVQKSYAKMQDFIKVLESQCGYKTGTYQASLQCNSNNARQ